MKFLRIRPETWAKTWCLFSNSTLNSAFGRVSTTTAITSIASSFDKRSPSSGHGMPFLCIPYILFRGLLVTSSSRMGQTETVEGSRTICKCIGKGRETEGKPLRGS